MFGNDRTPRSVKFVLFWGLPAARILSLLQVPTTFVSGGGGGGGGTLTGLGLAAITYLGPLLSFLSVEIYFYFGPRAGHAS